MTTFYACGLDLGQQRDYSSLSVLSITPSQVKRLVRDEDPEYHLPREYEETVDWLPLDFTLSFLTRWPLRTPYHVVTAGVTQVMRRFRTIPLLAVDRGGVGAAVYDELVMAGLEPMGIAITGGLQPSIANGLLNVPSKDLMDVLRVALENDRFHIPRDLKDREGLEAELQGMRAKFTATGRTRYEADRESTHDDRLFSIALAAWLAQEVFKASLDESGAVELPAVRISPV